jgi:cytoskeleton protein RodZ
VSEPLAIEPEQAPAEGQGQVQAAAAGFGYALAQMRVRVGLSIEQAAGRLRLHPKQLRAIEAEDLEALPAAAYVNGFVRNYARELGMDAGPLIEDLNAKLKLRGLIDSPPDLGSAGASAPPVLDERGWRHLVLAAIVIGLVCAGLIGVWMARSGGAGRAAAAPERSSAPPAAPGAPALAASPGAASVAAGSPEPADAAPGREAPSPPEPTPAEGRAPIVMAVAPATPAAGAAGGATGGPTGGTAAGPTAGTAAGTTAAAGQMAAPSAGMAPARAPAAEAAGAGASASTVSANPGSAAPAASSGGGTGAGLVLRFNDRSWFQVSRPDGRVLMSHNAEAGSTEMVNAAPPLQLVVGRADAVQVEYRGQPVNLKPYVNNQGVARLILGDRHPTSGGQNSR